MLKITDPEVLLFGLIWGDASEKKTGYIWSVCRHMHGGCIYREADILAHKERLQTVYGNIYSNGIHHES